MYCSKCGQLIENSSAFCPFCGEPISDSIAEEILNKEEKIEEKINTEKAEERDEENLLWSRYTNRAENHKDSTPTKPYFEDKLEADKEKDLPVIKKYDSLTAKDKKNYSKYRDNGDDGADDDFDDEYKQGSKVLMAIIIVLSAVIVAAAAAFTVMYHSGTVSFNFNKTTTAAATTTVTTTTTTAVPGFKAQSTYTVTANPSLRIRSSASTTGNQIGTLKNGTKIYVEKIQQGNNSSNWGYITYNGISGWICLDGFVSFVGNGNLTK